MIKVDLGKLGLPKRSRTGLLHDAVAELTVDLEAFRAIVRRAPGVTSAAQAS